MKNNCWYKNYKILLMAFPMKVIKPTKICHMCFCGKAFNTGVSILPAEKRSFYI